MGVCAGVCVCEWDVCMCWCVYVCAGVFVGLCSGVFVGV
jgi:hypothetical protein